jgi:peptide/nickel transport system permease protein
MTAETKRTLVAVVRRVVFSLLVLLFIWVLLIGLRGAIPQETIELLKKEAASNSSPGAPAIASNPLAWDWSRSLWTGKAVSGSVSAGLPVTLKLVALAGVCSLVAAFLLLLLGGFITRLTRKPLWLDRLRQALARIIVSSGASLPIFAVATLMIVYPMLWWGEGVSKSIGQVVGPWAIAALALFPVWLLVQSGQGELSNWRRPGSPWPHAGASLIVRLFKIAGGILAISLLIEQNYAQPGLGRGLIDAVNMRDYPVLFNMAWVFAIMTVAARLVGDLLEILYQHFTRAGTAVPATPDSDQRWRMPVWWTVVCLALIAGSLVFAIVGPLFARYGSNEMVLGQRLLAPSSAYPMGTDNLGRDVLSRVLYGTRNTIFTAVLSTMAVAAAAVAWGLLGGVAKRVKGWAGDALEDIVMIPKEMGLAFPWLVLMLLLMSVLPSPGVIATFLVALLAILPRAISMVQEAYRSPPYAAGWLAAILRSIPGMVVFSTAAGILYVSALTFLGFGLLPPAPELGGMLSGAARRYMLQAPWMALWPALVLSLLSFVWVLAGDALQERFGFRAKATWSKAWE